MSKRKSEVGKIYKTTDGFLGGKPQNKKKRNVVVLHQRKDDNALAVSKIHSDKPTRNRSRFVEDLVLSPEKHPSLKENSIVNKSVQFAVTQKSENTDKKTYKPIFKGDMTDTKDRLSRKELRQVKRKAETRQAPKTRRTYKKRLRSWKKHFNKKTESTRDSG